MPRIKRAKPGDFLQIPLDDATWSYGRVLLNGAMAFYNLVCSEDLPLQTIQESPILFKVCVMRYALNGKTWKVLGNLPLEPAFLEPPLFLHIRSKAEQAERGHFIATTNATDEIYVDYETAKSLELLAIYEPTDVEMRLHLQFQGKADPETEGFYFVK